MTNNKIKLEKVKLTKYGGSFFILVPSQYIKVYNLDTTETKEYDVMIKPSGELE